MTTTVTLAVHARRGLIILSFHYRFLLGKEFAQNSCKWVELIQAHVYIIYTPVVRSTLTMAQVTSCMIHTYTPATTNGAHL